MEFQKVWAGTDNAPGLEVHFHEGVNVLSGDITVRKHRTGFQQITNQSENLVANHDTISANHDTISANHDTISANHGTISANHGTISANHGTISRRKKANDSHFFL